MILLFALSYPTANPYQHLKFLSDLSTDQFLANDWMIKPTSPIQIAHAPHFRPDLACRFTTILSRLQFDKLILNHLPQRTQHIQLGLHLPNLQIFTKFRRHIFFGGYDSYYFQEFLIQLPIPPQSESLLGIQAFLCESRLYLR